MKKATKTATKSKSKSAKKVITPDMGVDKELIDFGKKALAEAINSILTTNRRLI